VEASPDLAALASETDRALEPLGLKPEGRPFSPHLTLARIKEPVPLQKLRETIAALPSLDFGSFSADRFLPLPEPPRSGRFRIHQACGVSACKLR
jgi:2'-5' RNA ligase